MTDLKMAPWSVAYCQCFNIIITYLEIDTPNHYSLKFSMKVSIASNVVCVKLLRLL